MRTFEVFITTAEVAATVTCPLAVTGGTSVITQVAVMTFDYDDLGSRVLVRDPAGKDTVTAPNAAGQPVTVTDATNATTLFTYLPNTGWADTVVVAGVSRARFEYDDAGRIIRQHAQNSAGTSNVASDEFTFDWVGNRKTHKRPNGVTDTFDYDTVNRLVKSSTDIGTTGVAASAVSEAGFDVGGNLVNVKDARGNVTTMSYNNWGLIGTLVEPSTPAFPNVADRQWTTTYDAGGLATGETRPGGVAVTRAFDGQGRMTSETGSGAGVTTASRSFGFDVGSRMTSAGSQQFTYDSRGLLAGSSGPQGASTFGFDIVGRMSTRTDASGTTSFGYNNRSDLTTVVKGTATTSYGWLASGELDTVSYPQGVNRKYTYDDLGRPTDDHVKTSAAATLSRRQYTYNTDSTVASTTVTQPGNTGAGVFTYGYDKGQRLTSTTVSGVTKSYGFDAAGNRSSADGQTYSYDARNRLVAGAGTMYNWSARGTLVSTTGTGAAAYAHDGLDRLTQAGAVTYAYDSLDRVTTRTQGTATTFGYAGAETDPVSDGTATYTRSPSGALHGVTRAGVFLLAGSDRHGDITFTLNPTTGVVADSTVRDPWGKTLGTTGATPATGFQGDWTDPTSGLVWMAARWYQPNTGTFTARDTYPGEVGAYATLNRYTYGLNNPLKYSDPTGRVAAPAGCDNSCQSSHLQQTGELYDDPADSFNDKYQRGDRDPTTEIGNDANGNPVITVYNDVGISHSTAGATVRQPLVVSTTTSVASNGNGEQREIPLNPFIPKEVYVLAGVKSFGAGGAAGNRSAVQPNFGDQLVYKHRSLIKKLARAVGVNASVIAKILMEENNFAPLAGKFVEAFEEVAQCVKGECDDTRSGVANMHPGDVDFLFDTKELKGAVFDRKFIFDLIGDLPDSIYDETGKPQPKNRKPRPLTEGEKRKAIFEKGRHDDVASITLLALYLGTTARHLDNQQTSSAGSSVTRDEALILSRKTGGYAAASLYAGDYDKYRETVVGYYKYLRPDLDSSPGRRPSWLNRYDKYNPDPILAAP